MKSANGFASSPPRQRDIGKFRKMLRGTVMCSYRLLKSYRARADRLDVRFTPQTSRPLPRIDSSSRFIDL